MALTDRYRRRVRFITGLVTYSTAITYQLAFGQFYPEVIPNQFPALVFAWILLLSIEEHVIESTDYGPQFVLFRSLVGTNALFSIVAGDNLQPIISTYTYEFTLFLAPVCVMTFLALLVDLRADPSLSILPNS